RYTITSGVMIRHQAKMTQTIGSGRSLVRFDQLSTYPAVNGTMMPHRFRLFLLSISQPSSVHSIIQPISKGQKGPADVIGSPVRFSPKLDILECLFTHSAPSDCPASEARYKKYLNQVASTRPHPSTDG